MEWLRKALLRWALRSVSVAEFYNSLPRVKVQKGGPYTASRRYEDFRAVFSGHSTPEQGQRVLSQILALCNTPKTLETEINDHALLAWRAARRNIGEEIVRWTMPPKN